VVDDRKRGQQHLPVVSKLRRFPISAT
jgi:hypothetical protein